MDRRLVTFACAAGLLVAGLFFYSLATTFLWVRASSDHQAVEMQLASLESQLAVITQLRAEKAAADAALVATKMELFDAREQSKWGSAKATELPIKKTEDGSASQSIRVGRKQTIGNIELFVNFSSVGRITLDDDIRKGGGLTSEKSFIRVSVAIKNNSTTKLVWYDPWGSRPLAFGSGIASMRDEFSNAYPNISFSLGVRPIGQLKGKIRIDPGETATDIIIFDQPIEKAKKVMLHFPGRNVGEKSDFAISVSREFLLGDSAN